MNKFQKSLASAIATGALLVNSVLPAFATTTIEISGNGSGSLNTSGVSFTQSTTVVQSNNADVYNNVDADAETGGNSANDNTGGDVNIETGDADVEVSVENNLNQNTAEVDCCVGGDTEVLISGNGSNSINTTGLEIGNQTSIFQTNDAQVKNIVDADAETGENRANGNTNGDVSISTGDASTGVSLSTTANANSARVGGGEHAAGGSLSVRILGNGTDSINTVDLALGDLLAIVQDNTADVYNNVDADAETGENKAGDNTGGDVSVETGDATTDVSVDNMVNFNWADADCGCLLEDLMVKIAENGSGTINTIGAELGSDLTVAQDNCGQSEECELDNIVDAGSETGENKAKDNTGDAGGDPSIETGDADSSVEVENSGNSNVYGAMPDWDMPEWDFNLNFSFDLSDLLDWLHSHS